MSAPPAMRGGRRATLALLLAAFALTTAACNSGQGAADQLAAIKDRGVIRFVSDPNYAPQSFYNQLIGRWQGFDVDVATEIAHRHGVEPNFQAGIFADVADGNWDPSWDMSVGSVTVTPQRAQKLDFTTPYYYSGASIAVNQDNTSIKNASDLSGKRIGVTEGSTYESYLKGTLELPGQGAIPSAIQNAQIVAYPTDQDAIDDLAVGDGVRLDAVISAGPTLQHDIDNGSNVKIVGSPLFTEELAAAVVKGRSQSDTSLVKRVSQIIQQMHDDGTLTALSKKYYGKDLTTKPT